MLINFEIATPEKIVFKALVSQISLPTKMGEITILPNHEPLVAALSPGVIKIIKDGGEKFLAIGEGFAEIQTGNRAIILAENAETAEEIDIERAERARRRAEELMKEKNVQDVEYTALAAKIERELARLKVARRHSKGKNLPSAE